MKKFFLSLLGAMMVTVASFAQNTLVATLSHGEEVTMYYGSSAFMNAMNAATSGDVITLSGGTFNGGEIKKAVIIRGTGMDAENPSIITHLTFSIPEEETERFSMEGITIIGSIGLNGTIVNPLFLKCKIRDLSSASNSNISDAKIVNCKIISYLSLNGQSTIKVVNSLIYGMACYSPATAQFLNCVLQGSNGAYNGSTFINSILIATSYGTYSYVLPASTLAMNCVSTNTYANGFNAFSSMQGSEVDCSNVAFAGLFKTYKGGYTDSETFELSDEAKATYLGTDGTEVGLYGGQYPYTSVPAYPRISKLNVAKQATADNKLSVEIEVSAAE